MNEERMIGPEVHPGYQPDMPTPEEQKNLQAVRAEVANRLGLEIDKVPDSEILRFFREQGFQMLSPEAAEAVRLDLARMGFKNI